MTRNARNEVLIIVPPNSNTVIENSLLTVTQPQEHSDWSDFPCLGALSLTSALKQNPSLIPLYVDGNIIDIPTILSYISSNSNHILAVCISALTDSYEAGTIIARHAKAVDNRIWTVVGNDHFTALPDECLRHSKCFDFGFVGNEVIAPFSQLMGDLRAGVPIKPDAYPGLTSKAGDSVKTTPFRPESVFSHYSYSLIDEGFSHTHQYSSQFKQRIAPRVRELLGKTVTAGVPIELGRGCVKFANNDACSFCSIQYGGMWRNQLSPGGAWQVVTAAWEAGYDYLNITADELPLTFVSLLNGMNSAKPKWWRDLSAEDRPMLVGYARADGIADERRTRLLVDLGIRQVMIGMDAGSAISLAAMNKPLGGRHRDIRQAADQLFELNWKALQVARDHGLLIKAGFVIGHIGMTPEILTENIERIEALISKGRDIITAVDVEVLSPQPGSRDFIYLTSPQTATVAAERLGLSIAELNELNAVAANWRDRDVVPSELTMRDFARAFMPEVGFDALATARSQVRNFAQQAGIMVGV
jgi:anaerobic magnesium-protoporphyrin IX monomethyl ester cyclase